MTKHVSVQPDEALGDCPECGLPYYHILRHIGGGITYIHSDVDVLATGIEVEYCYAESVKSKNRITTEELPTSATIMCAVHLLMHGGLPQFAEVFFDEEHAMMSHTDSLSEYTNEHPDWEEGKDAAFYSDLYDTGDFDDESYLIDAFTRKDTLPIYRLARRLASSLYDVMTWVLKDEGVKGTREPDHPKVTVYSRSMKLLAEAYDEFKGVGFRKIGTPSA